ncbi:autotransporter outer membrane beta-barrel domain-containing protein [Escherichia coli]|nr:autotransporter outer membrane beta-barrel domain-containing protein [Escherichia coli]
MWIRKAHQFIARRPSYISNIAAANSLFSHRLHDRLGEPQACRFTAFSRGPASGMWMRHVGGHERSRAGDGQLNTQANRYVLQLGGDLAQWSSNAQDRWHLGVMANTPISTVILRVIV